MTLVNVTVSLNPRCEFEGDASSQDDLFALFIGLNLGETFEVEVFGVGTLPTPNEILCYLVKSKVN